MQSHKNPVQAPVCLFLGGDKPNIMCFGICLNHNIFSKGQ